MKTITVLLINGMSVYRISCEPDVNVSSAEGIVTGLQNNKATLIGSGRVSFDKQQKRHFHEMVYLDGTAMISPNRCKHVHTLTNVEKRHAFADCFKSAKLADIAPEALKVSEPVSGWHVEDAVVNCANCGKEIPGTKRVNGSGGTQKFVPSDKGAFNVGKKWYEKDCSRIITPPAPEEPVAVKSTEPEAIVTVTFTGTVTAVALAIQEYAKGRK
jgi:hypothetical protein